MLVSSMNDHPVFDPSAAIRKKGKSGTRAKSGCWTCRIRRKKCDEKKDDSGYCEACVRLHLQCLGWGNRRPDWMRENVGVFRDKIKNFLASQGMIKGHSGAAPRPADDTETPYCLLHPEGPRAFAPSTSATSLSTSPYSEGGRYPTSHARDDLHNGSHGYSSRGSLLLADLLCPEPPRRDLSHPGLLNGAVARPLQPSLEGFASDYSPQSHQRSYLSINSANSAITSGLVPYILGPPFPPKQSSFSPLYSLAMSDFERELSPPVEPYPIGLNIPFNPEFTDSKESQYVEHYMNEVVKVQYMLADAPSLSSFLRDLAFSSESARNAMCMLASVHRHLLRTHNDDPSLMQAPETSGFTNTRFESTPDVHMYYRKTRDLLSYGPKEEGDAMAGLIVVSSCLFAGGRGPWERFLNVACKWVENTLQDRRFSNVAEALLFSKPSTNFIVRTTMWFDVWASITQLRQPRFLGTYRQLFSPRAFIDDGMPPQLEMMSVMGCSNEIFLAMAEIAALAYWKHERQRAGNLSVPELVQRGNKIEDALSEATEREPGDVAFLALQSPQTKFNLTPDDVEKRRRLVNRVFRGSAKVYLASVLSGCRPQVPEIKSGVAEVITYLKVVPGYTDSSRVVIRSVVFSICICGCLTDDPEQRKFLMSQLDTLGHEGGVIGNCRQAKKLIERVWAKRAETGEPVCWRETMEETGSEILLLV